MDASTGKREWIYPAWVKGAFQTRRRWTFTVLHIILFITPWIHVRDRQIIQLVLSSRQLILAGEIFTPQDTVFLVFGLLFSTFLLFFVTAMWGRVWCGYACPQTVFLETFVHAIERRIEGNRGKRMALDRAAWTPEKIAKKVTKHAIFLAAAGLIGACFVGWFVGTRVLFTGNASSAAYDAVAFFAAVMYLDFVWCREQFCNYLCPYAVFQGVIAGANSLVITYDQPRGEPRRQRGVQQLGPETGDGIGCSKCVSVCPVGIDIRDGYQLECIGCAKCVDACAPIMGRFGKENRVRYSTAVEDAGGKSRQIRTRPMIYVALMALTLTTAAALLMSRHPLDVTVNRGAGTLYTLDADGATRNTFMLRITNRKYSEEAAAVTVSVAGIPDAESVVPPITMSTGETLQVPMVVRAPASADLERTAPITIQVQTDFDTVVLPTTFKTGAITGG